MGNVIYQQSQSGPGEPGKPDGDMQNGTTRADTDVSKRTAVRQRLAIALMAVGGVLLAAIIWLTINNQSLKH